MKQLYFILLLLLFVVVSYSLGYLKAANNISFPLSITSAKTSFATLYLLENKQYEEIRKLHKSEVDLTMTALEDIMKTEGKLSEIPIRLKLYRSMVISAQNKEKLVTDLRTKQQKTSEKHKQLNITKGK